MIDNKTKKPCFCDEGGICDNCYEYEFDRVKQLEAELKAEREKNAEQQELIEKLKDCLFEHYICPECISSEYSLEAEGTMYCQVCEYEESSE